jgi:hypothetical protein
VPDTEKTRVFTVVNSDGKRYDVDLTHDDAIEFAMIAASDFGVGESDAVTFDPDLAKKDISGEGDVKATRKSAKKTAAKSENKSEK